MELSRYIIINAINGTLQVYMIIDMIDGAA